MEFVIATFPQVRGLRMDGAPQGQTGQVIGVQRGHHIFDLGNPKDYVPVSVPAVVAGTSQAQPMVISFQPAVQAVPAVPAAATPRAVGAAALAPELAAVPGSKAMVRGRNSAKKFAAAPAKKEKKRAKKSAKAPTKKGLTGNKAKPTTRARAKRGAKKL
jgi:hypothetical protein